MQENHNDFLEQHCLIDQLYHSLPTSGYSRYTYDTDQLDLLFSYPTEELDITYSDFNCHQPSHHETGTLNYPPSIIPHQEHSTVTNLHMSESPQHHQNQQQLSMIFPYHGQQAHSQSSSTEQFQHRPSSSLHHPQHTLLPPTCIQIGTGQPVAQKLSPQRSFTFNQLCSFTPQRQAPPDPITIAQPLSVQPLYTPQASFYQHYEHPPRLSHLPQYINADESYIAMDIKKLKTFAKRFQEQREAFSYAQTDVAQQVSIRFQFTISAESVALFEHNKLELSDMAKLKTYLQQWILDIARTRGRTEVQVQDLLRWLCTSYNTGRRLINTSQSDILEEEYLLDDKPDLKKLIEISKRTEVSVSVLRTWYRYRRKKTKYYQ